jgi:TrmH family RNA methyltransferase
MLLLDGPHLVSDALDAGIGIEGAIAAADGASRPEIGSIVARLLDAGAPVSLATAPVMAAVSPVRSPSAIVAIARRRTVREGDLYVPSPALVVIAADVQDPGNLGAIVRAAEAAGATGAIAAGSSADPFGWKALRGSMGSALRLPVRSARTAAEAAGTARAHGCRIAAAVPRGGSDPSMAPLGDQTAVLIGGEGRGLEEAVVDGADVRISIPMQPPVESLNAAVTAALILYEARRQRGRPVSR